MSKLFPLNRTVVLFLSIGLLMLSCEIFFQHHHGLPEKKHMWIPIIFGLCGGIVGLFITIIFNKVSYYLFLVLITLSMIVGALGLYFHNQLRVRLILFLLLQHEPVSIDFLATKPPLFAPSSFIAIGLLGLLIALHLPWKSK